jgi:outer membrane protein assembly factor BamA
MLLLVCARASCAEDRFLIERIDVRKLVHASADVIRAESRLHEGESYAEADLRAASDRVRRLPFMLDAAFSLERGFITRTQI